MSPGGALLDVGSYTIGRMVMHFGCDIRSVRAHFEYFETGVDSREVIEFEYEDGLQVKIVNGVSAEVESETCVLYGTLGRLVLQGTANPKRISVYNLSDDLIKEIDVPEQISGYEYEFIACEKALENQKKSCEEMPHDLTLFIVKTMDRLRTLGNIRFPFE